jgi:hypothetical protein
LENDQGGIDLKHIDSKFESIERYEITNAYDELKSIDRPKLIESILPKLLEMIITPKDKFLH